MIVLLAAGVGVCVAGLLAIGFSVPISDTSFGNALTIGGVMIVCTGIVLIGMSFVARELAKLTKLVGTQGVSAARPTASSRPAMAANPFATGDAATDGIADRAAASASPPPWAEEVATRARPRPAAPEIPPVEPVVAQPPPAPDRPARRNLLFSTKRRDKAELEQPAAPPMALEAEPRVSFEDAWPNPPRPNGSAERYEPSMVPAEPAGNEAADAVPDAPTAADASQTPGSDLPPGVTVVRSGTVDEMAYTYYSDGSIEAQLAGESPIRFASLDALRTYVEQRK